MRLDHEFREKMRFAACSTARRTKVAPGVVEKRQKYAGGGEG